MASDKDQDRVWKMMEKMRICMLVSRDGDDIRARPMAAHAAPDEHAIYFLTDVESHKDEEIARDPSVALTFADTSGQDYLSVSGRAEVSNDREKIRELWSTPAKAWWDSPDDPSIRVLKVTPSDAQYWDSPGSVVSSVKMLTAAATGSRPDMGDQAKVKM